VQEVDIEDQVEIFMKRQAELESGAAFARTRDPSQVIGADMVDEEEAKALCREIVGFLKLLKKTRDMSVNECKLIIAIEDPRATERRNVGIEDERGVSRDEMAAALAEVAEGRIPKDRLALKCLYEDMSNWPYLNVEQDSQPAPSSSSSSPASMTSSDYATLTEGGGVAKPYIMGGKQRAGEKPQGLADMLPDWVGYGTLYGISALPAIIAVATVIVLFYSSLR